MSGGSFDYLYAKEIEDLVHSEDYISSMIAELEERGEPGAARKTESFLNMLKAYRVVMDMMETSLEVERQQLTDVWKAVEWCCSGDWGEDRVHKECRKMSDRSK